MNTDYQSRLAVIEQKQRHYDERQDQLRTNQEEISKDLRTTSQALQKLSSDIGILVTNVSHLTMAMEKISENVDTLRGIELEMVNLRSEASSVSKLWDQLNTLKAKVDSQNIVIRAIQVLAGTLAVSLVGIAVARLYGGG